MLAYKEMCNYRDSLVRAFYNGALSGKYEDVAGFLVGDVTKFFPDNMNVYDPKYNYVKVCANLKACKKFLEPFNKTKIKKDHPKSNENMAIFSPSGFDNVKKEIVFSRDGDTIWQCANCGHIYLGKKAPEVCPVCAHPQAYFQIKAENY